MEYFLQIENYLLEGISWNTDRELKALIRENKETKERNKIPTEAVSPKPVRPLQGTEELQGWL